MYICQVSPKAFVSLREEEICFVADPSKASTFKTIGDAMRTAAEINTILDSYLVKVIHLNDLINWKGPEQAVRRSSITSLGLNPYLSIEPYAQEKESVIK